MSEICDITDSLENYPVFQSNVMWKPEAFMNNGECLSGSATFDTFVYSGGFNESKELCVI